MLGSPRVSGDAIEIVVADDHRIVREGLRFVLEVEADLSVVGEARGVAEAERVLRARRPTVLLLDLLMGDESSLPALPSLRAASPTTAIVILTMEAHPLVARDAIRRGAMAYLSKDAETSELIAAIRSAASGLVFLDPRLGARLAIEHGGESEDLTERDIQILRMVALGHTNAEIAALLHLSVRTVEAYRVGVQRKVALSTRAQVVEYVRTRRLSR